MAASQLRHQNQRNRSRLQNRERRERREHREHREHRERREHREHRERQRHRQHQNSQHISKIVDNQGIVGYTLSPDLLFGKKTGTISNNPVVSILRVGRPTLLFYKGIYA